MNTTYIQSNDRNISYKCWDDILHDFVFIKESKLYSFDSPIFEIIPLNLFREINTKMCPELVRFSYDGKLVYRYISNYHVMRLDSPFIESNLKELGQFLSSNYKLNVVENLRLRSNSFRYLQHNKVKWIIRVLNLIKYVDSENIQKKLYITSNNILSSNNCLCHGDIVFSNILCDRENIIVTDFEYSLISEPEFDLSRFFSRLLLYYYNDNNLALPRFINSFFKNFNIALDIVKLFNYIGFHLLDYLYCHLHYNSLENINNKDVLLPLANELLFYNQDTLLLSEQNKKFIESIMTNINKNASNN